MKKRDPQSLSPTPSTSKSVSFGSSGKASTRVVTIAEVIKLLRKSGLSEVADYLQRREQLRSKIG